MTLNKKRSMQLNNNSFAGCEVCIIMKGPKKSFSYLEELNIEIEDNGFESIKSNCLQLENICPGRLTILRNTAAKCSSIAFKLIGCRAYKEDIQLCQNFMTNIYNSAICIYNSTVTVFENVLNACQGGVILHLAAISSTNNKEELLDSHKDIILKDSVKDTRESLLAIGSTNSLRIGSSPSFQTPGTLASGIFDLGSAPSLSRVILKANKFKEIALFGILIQHNSSSSVKIAGCQFKYVKEPVLLNEKDLTMSRNYTRNFFPSDNSDLLAPTSYPTPRQTLQNCGKGTIVVKDNVFEGSETCVIRKHVSSYLYDMNNLKQLRQNQLHS